MNYNIEDDELLYLISENNEEAEEIFYEKYRDRIEIKAKKYFNIVRGSGIELNDLIQEGMMGLTEALRNFKNQKNTKFTTFADICIDRKMLTYVRSVTSGKNKALNNSLSMDTTLNSNGKSLLELIKDDSNINPEEIFINNENYDELILKLDKILSKQEKNVFLLRINGFSYIEISLLLKITKKSAERTMARVREKLENINKNID